MSPAGGIVAGPARRMRLTLAIQAVWIAAVCSLGAWWGHLLWKQCERIAELERIAGLASEATAGQLGRTQRMLFWESASFFALLLAITTIVFWLYWRDLRRARALQAFFASVTHELRTPLTSIRLQAESLADALETTGTDPRAQTWVGRLLEDSGRLESQVERTLELARVEGGGRLLPRPVRMRPLVERVLRTWGEATRRTVNVRASLGEDAVFADESAFQVIARNLLENSARHAGREGVTLDLRSARVDGGVELVFRDDGQGFRGEAARLGRPFERGEQSSGAGIGLYLVRTLMERMGGRARFASASPGRGFEVGLWFRSPDGGDATGRRLA